MVLAAATGYWASVGDAVARMLAACAAFQTATGYAGSATNARHQIIIDDAGDLDRQAGASYAMDGATVDPTRYLAIVGVGSLRPVARAWNQYGREGEATIRLFELVDTAAVGGEARRTAENTAGTIRDQLEALFNTDATYLPAGLLQVVGSITAPDGVPWPLAGRIVTDLHLDWKDIP